MGTLLKDLSFSLRTLSRNPGFSIVVILTLTLGIGATTAIFTVVHGILLRPLSYGDPDRIVLVSDSKPEAGIPRTGVSYLNYRDYRDNNQVFETMTAVLRVSYNLTGSGNPERFAGAPVSADYFRVLGIEPFLGRGFARDEDKPGSDPVVVLSHDLWTRRFGADPEIIGRSLNLNNTPRTVIGIGPEAVDFADFWVPMTADYSTTARDLHFLRVLARLAPGVSLEQARAEMKTLAVHLEQEHPETNKGWTVDVTSLHETIVERVRPSLLILLLAVGLLLLVACSNLASLTLSRLTAREQEIAVRTAIGAGRWQLARQLVLESFVLALVGGILGVLLAGWGTRALMALSADSLPLTEDLRINSSILFFAILVTLAITLLFGLLPALQASRVSPQQALREGGRGQLGRKRSHLVRGGLVLMQVTLALVLLIGAGLLIRSFQRLQEVDIGFDPTDVLTMRLSLPTSEYPDDACARFHSRLDERLRSVPGVEEVGIVYPLPLDGGGFALKPHLQGRPPNDAHPAAAVRAVSPGYFETARIPLIRGRHFTQRDDLEAQQVAIINETSARAFWPGEDPIGQSFTFDALDAEVVNWWTVVGIVGDVRYGSVTEEGGPEVYRPMAQRPRWSVTVAVRAASDPSALLAPVSAAIWELDPNLPLYNVRPFSEILSGAVARPRFNTLLLGLFAGLALTLTSLGVYGTVNYSVTGRLREIAIRLALGATRLDAITLVLKQGMRPVLVGLGIGLFVAFLAVRLLAGLVFGVQTTDPVTFVGSLAVLVAVALLACLVPGLRATRIDPASTLRAE